MDLFLFFVMFSKSTISSEKRQFDSILSAFSNGTKNTGNGTYVLKTPVAELSCLLASFPGSHVVDLIPWKERKWSYYPCSTLSQL